MGGIIRRFFDDVKLHFCKQKAPECERRERSVKAR